ncbi:DHA1 family bicyclomycin/chloramphenicol resistance-like MFS transporter [Pseudomonas hunanensis]|uniref:DHA1 family bicyclomycin/chloramphenicol resistance-like MFS transporter n=1 Tax=Pseudomonas hunanensis TaxID=1247546 RepID=A0ACC6JY13_9PSED|nr:DHA1 family bicyclomycin/chloramphenicol resistance-like MFS transporter [Pseudomonas hunanensis]
MIISSIRSFQRLIITLLLLMGLLGVFPLDVILPSFPALSAEFAVQSADIAWSVSLFAVGVAVSQCLIGPVSDRVGRKRLLLLGLITAAAGAVGCALAETYASFIYFRLLQAAGCGCFVLSQALVQDLFRNQQRTAVRILLTTASGLFISLSPLAGSVLQALLGWQGSFQLFIGLAAGVFLLSVMLLNEAPLPQRPSNPLRSYWALLNDSAFMTYSLLSALAFACHFSFIVISPLLFMDRLGLSTYAFSMVFIGYGMAYLLGGVLASALNGKLASHAQISLGLMLIGCAGLVMLGWVHFSGLTVAGVMLPMVICTAGTTITRAVATTCAMDLHSQRAGAAAALNNTLLFALGGLLSGLLAVVEASLPSSLAVGFIATSIGGCWAFKRVVRRRYGRAG